MSRFIRQLDLVPPVKLAEQRILLVGAGAVGRNLGNTLAALGAKNVCVIDLDNVDLVNLCTQGYTKHDVGKPKASVLVESMNSLDYEGDAKFTADTEPWRPIKYQDYHPTIIFSCVDQMHVRQSIFKFFERVESAQLFVDSRMSGEVVRLICVDRQQIDYYNSTLFTDEQAYQGRCTQQSTMWAASLLAQLMAGQMSLFLRGYPRKKDQLINLLDMLMG